MVYTKLFVEEVTKDESVYFLHATNVSGIVQGVPVMMQGYPIGSVASIAVEYEPSLNFKVELIVNKKVKIPRGSEVVLGSRLGQRGLWRGLRRLNSGVGSGVVVRRSSTPSSHMAP